MRTFPVGLFGVLRMIAFGPSVELTVNGDHIGVTLNRKAAQKQGLEFNAQLLRLAKVVEP